MLHFLPSTHAWSLQQMVVYFPDIIDPLQPLEDVIQCTLLPTLLKISPPNDVTCRLIALPPRWGGLGIFVLTVQCELEYTASLDITRPLSSCIGSGKPFNYFDIRSSQYSKKYAIHLSRQSLHSALSSALRPELDKMLQTALDHATIKGASTWLSALPLSEYGFACTKPLFMMPSPCAIDGLYAASLLTVHPVLSSQLTMPFLARRGLPSL